MVCAYHEAGHSIACAALGGMVNYADIINVPWDRDGLTVVSCQPPRCASHVAYLLAGGLTVWEAAWRRREKFTIDCNSDRNSIREKIACWYHDESEPPAMETTSEYLEGEEIALRVIGDFWGPITTVAEFLLDHERIEGRLVHALVAQHTQRAGKEVYYEFV
jgi:hypothetical protein